MFYLFQNYCIWKMYNHIKHTPISKAKCHKTLVLPATRRWMVGAYLLHNEINLPTPHTLLQIFTCMSSCEFIILTQCEAYSYKLDRLSLADAWHCGCDNWTTNQWWLYLMVIQCLIQCFSMCEGWFLLS